MKKVSLFLTEKQILALKELAAQTGLKFAEIIRRMIDEYLERHKK